MFHNTTAFYNNDIFLVQAKWASQIGMPFCVCVKILEKWIVRYLNNYSKKNGIAAIAAIAFGIYKYLSREDDVDDFEDDFEDDFDDDFEDEEDDFVKEDEAAPAKDEE